MQQSERNSRSVPVEENMPCQIRGWYLERLGWYGLLVLLLLALTGLFANGPLSDARVASATGDLQVRYQRFARNGAQTLLRVTMPASSFLDISGDLASEFSIESIQPAPARSTSDGKGGLRLHIEGRGAVSEVSIRLKAEGVGRHRSTLQAGSEKVDISQFIYP